MIALHPGDPGYPARLRDLRHAPDPLWVEGDLGVFAARSIVAVVGTRRMTAYGERVARELAGAIAASGALVVSGLAQGIDATAHAAALDAGGLTVAVLGAGISAYLRDVPRARRALTARVIERGALVSQYPPDAPALGWMFARRNATIAAVANAVVVIEAPIGSGALITAREGARLGRAVYAVPGPLGAVASAGANELIASGAARVLTGPASLGIIAARSEPDDPILERLAAGPMPPDALGADAARVAALLLDGRIVALPDGRLARR